MTEGTAASSIGVAMTGFAFGTGMEQGNNVKKKYHKCRRSYDIKNEESKA